MNPKKQRVRAKSATGKLSSEEGYIWSRLGDGISVDELLPLCPFNPEDTQKKLTSLVSKGAAEWIASTAEDESSKNKPEELEVFRMELEADELSPTPIDIDRKFRVEILKKIEQCTDEKRSGYEILECSPRSSENDLKAAYLALSKKFHPDRFFRKNLGHYKRKLDFIFSVIQKAYAQLKNPIEREAIDRTIALHSRPASHTAKKSSRPKTLDPEFEKIGKAEHYFRQGQKLMKSQNYIEAYEHFAAAQTLVPKHEAYDKALSEARPLMTRQEALIALEELQKELQTNAPTAAMLDKIEVILRKDPELADALLIFGKIVLDLKLSEKMRDAKERILRAKAKLPNDAEPYVQLARYHILQGDNKAAKKEVQEACKLDPNHPGMKRLLESLD